MKQNLKNLGYSLAGATTVALLSVGSAFAEGGGAATPGLSSVTTAVTTAASEVKVEGAKVISAGIGVGIVFWGAKLCWTKFKSIAK